MTIISLEEQRRTQQSLNLSIKQRLNQRECYTVAFEKSHYINYQIKKLTNNI